MKIFNFLIILCLVKILIDDLGEKKTFVYGERH